MRKLQLCVMTCFFTISCAMTPDSLVEPDPRFVLNISGKVVHIDEEIIGSFSVDGERFVVEHSIALYFVAPDSSETSARYMGVKEGNSLELFFTSVTDVNGFMEQFVNGKSIEKRAFTFLTN